MRTPVQGSGVTVQTFKFAGNTLLSDEQLAAVLVPYLNRPLDMAGLERATAAVVQAYRTAGWLARVYLPRQEITNGVVTLQVLEAVFGQVRLDGDAPMRVNTERINKIISTALPQGHLLDANKLDLALLLADDLPGVAASGNLAKGNAQGETDLLLKLADEALFAGDVGLDNTGARSTGRTRATLNGFINSPAKIGDLIAANVVHSSGSDYVRLAYTMPLGYRGLRLGVHGSTMDYRVINAEFAALDLTGNSKTLGVDLQYPLVRSRTKNVYASLALDHKDYQNKGSGAVTSAYSLHATNVGLSGNLIDQWGGGGANAVNVTFTRGDVRLGALNATENPELEGSFSKLRYAVSRHQALGQTLSLYAALSGQMANKNLDSSEKFYLGGSSGVRAYPSSEGGGADGQLLNLELRWRFKQQFVLSGFYDLGRVKQNHNNAVTSPATPNDYHLKGAGVSLTFNGPQGLTLTGTYARRLGRNPNPSAYGNDQDGSLIKNRFWLTAGLQF